MVLIKDVTDCSTSAVRGLDQQLIDEINAIVPNALVGIEDLNAAASGSSVWLLVQPTAKEALQRAINVPGFDQGTTGGDYSNDVLAQAQYYADNWSSPAAVA